MSGIKNACAATAIQYAGRQRNPKNMKNVMLQRKQSTPSTASTTASFVCPL